MEWCKKWLGNLNNVGLLYFLFMLVKTTVGNTAELVNRVEEATEVKVERSHVVDSQVLLMFIGLLIATILTIWLFKVKRFRYMHESGLSMIYGMIIGLIVKYAGAGPTAVGVPVTLINKTTAPQTLWVSIGNYSKFSYQLKGVLRTVTTKAGSELEDMAVFDPEIFFYVLLPPIIFFAGFNMQKRFFFRNLGAILMYAFVGTTISTVIFGAMIYGYTNMVHSEYYATFDFQKCLMFGSLISATDPVTVLAIFHDMHVDVDLYALMFGESVMNDAVAIVLYRTVESYTASGLAAEPVFAAIGQFIGVFGGSFLLGCLMGLVTALVTKLTNIKQFPQLETALFALMSYSTFLLAEIAQLTGIVAVLFCGIAQAQYTYPNLSDDSKAATKQMFGLLNFLSENFIFLYMGLTVFTFPQHQWQDVGFMAWSFLAMAISRLFNIYPLSFILNLQRKKKIPWNFQHMLFFAGLRGAVAFALAIRNTSSIPRQLMLTTVLVIVLATVIFNGSLTLRALQFLDIRVGVDPEEELKKDFTPDTSGPNAGQIPYERSPLVRMWRRFDEKYMKPLFTNTGRPIHEAFPKCCQPFLKCLSGTKEEQNDNTAIIDDDELLNVTMEQNAVSQRKESPSKGRGSLEDESSDLGDGSRVQLDASALRMEILT
ncbi:sodium/hydrogen exchanger 9-like [Rhopilema esculentum]|uniref:sodium/hydrogen exchanger 9-like n=1 Tax=Rhopilema esculentum TaxID=499914 RepID=UPI0031DC225C